MSFLFILRGLENDAGLADLGVALRWESDKGADVAVVRRTGDGERDEADFGISGFRELGSLADVFSDYELASDLRGEMQALERFVGSQAVGLAQDVGDGDLFHLGAGEDVQCDGLGR